MQVSSFMLACSRVVSEATSLRCLGIGTLRGGRGEGGKVLYLNRPYQVLIRAIKAPLPPSPTRLRAPMIWVQANGTNDCDIPYSTVALQKEPIGIIESGIQLLPFSVY